MEAKQGVLEKMKLTILIRNERSFVRAMYRVKLMDRKKAKQPMDMLDLQDTVDKLA